MLQDLCLGMGLGKRNPANSSRGSEHSHLVFIASREAGVQTKVSGCCQCCCAGVQSRVEAETSRAVKAVTPGAWLRHVGVIGLMSPVNDRTR